MTASTGMNDTSSRSHAIFTINFTQVGMITIVLLVLINSLYTAICKGKALQFKTVKGCQLWTTLGHQLNGINHRRHHHHHHHHHYPHCHHHHHHLSIIFISAGARGHRGLGKKIQPFILSQHTQLCFSLNTPTMHMGGVLKDL